MDAIFRDNYYLSRAIILSYTIIMAAIIMQLSEYEYMLKFIIA